MNILERNKETMRKFETVINTADVEMADKLIDPTASFYSPVSSDILYGGRGYLHAVYFMRTGFSDIKWIIKDMAAEENKVAVTWECTGTHDGNFMGVEPTGKKFKSTCMNFYYFNEKGQITNDISAEGLFAIIKPLGLVKFNV